MQQLLQREIADVSVRLEREKEDHQQHIEEVGGGGGRKARGEAYYVTPMYTLFSFKRSLRRRRSTLLKPIRLTSG